MFRPAAHSLTPAARHMGLSSRAGANLTRPTISSTLSPRSAKLDSLLHSPALRSRFHSGQSHSGQSNGPHSQGSHYSHSSSSGPGTRSRLHLGYLVVPLALTSSLTLSLSPLRLEPSQPHSLASITSALPSPVASEFRITQAQEDHARRSHRWYWRVLWLVRDYFIEPLSTTVRFVHLALLFLPVIAVSPILLLETLPEGPRRRRRRARGQLEEERATTRWWYALLVAQMRRAGPTFIKVSETRFEA